MSTNYPTPRNANEERIRAARASFASVDTLWASQASVKKSETPSAPAPSAHLSSFGGITTMRSAEAEPARKSDDLATLPASVRDRAQGFDAGQRALLSHIYAVHQKMGRPVPIDAGEAAKLMNSTPEKARAFISMLETAGLISRSYSALGPLLGFVPAIGA